MSFFFGRVNPSINAPFRFGTKQFTRHGDPTWQKIC